MTPAETPAPPDDEGLLDDVEEVVHEVLGSHLPTPEMEDPWERRQRILDSWTAVILSIAAVATAWATFQSSEWSSRQGDAVAAASTVRTESLRAGAEASEAAQIDTAVWLQWVQAVSTGDRRRAQFLEARFSPTLARAQRAWLDGAATPRTANAVPPGTPFDLPAYDVPAQARAERLTARSEALLSESQDDSANSTRFVVVALLFALVLFFAGVATKFRNPKVQVLLVAFSIGFAFFGLVRLVLLPHVL